jgi:serine/threonine-protein kinase
MGVVYRATHLRLGRTVALKVLPPSLAADRDYRRRFEREAAIAASLEHPNVVPIYDAGHVHGILYLSMRFVDGEDLGAGAPAGGPARRRARVRAARAGGRRPRRRPRGRPGAPRRQAGNVLIARSRRSRGAEQVYLCDFGIAKGSADAGHDITSPASTSARCSTPPRADPGPVDRRALGPVRAGLPGVSTGSPAGALPARRQRRGDLRPPRRRPPRPGRTPDCGAVDDASRATAKIRSPVPTCAAFIAALLPPSHAPAPGPARRGTRPDRRAGRACRRRSRSRSRRPLRTTPPSRSSGTRRRGAGGARASARYPRCRRAGRARHRRSSSPSPERAGPAETSSTKIARLARTAGAVVAHPRHRHRRRAVPPGRRDPGVRVVCSDRSRASRAGALTRPRSHCLPPSPRLRSPTASPRQRPRLSAGADALATGGIPPCSTSPHHRRRCASRSSGPGYTPRRWWWSAGRPPDSARRPGRHRLVRSPTPATARRRACSSRVPSPAPGTSRRVVPSRGRHLVVAPAFDPTARAASALTRTAPVDRAHPSTSGLPWPSSWKPWFRRRSGIPAGPVVEPDMTASEREGPMSAYPSYPMPRRPRAAGSRRSWPTCRRRSRPWSRRVAGACSVR